MQNESGRGGAEDDASLHPLPPPARIQELFFEAARLGRTDMLSPLLTAGADIEARNAQGYTALILASYHGHEAATAMLLRLGAAVDGPDDIRGSTALMGAAFKGFLSIADKLLDAGADPDATNRAGQTALMMASLFGQNGVADRLLAHGADPHIEDAAGNSAVSVAKMQRNDPMLQRLAGAADRV